MAGIGGLSPLRLFHQSIKTALEYNNIYIVNFHAREHIFGDLLDDTKGKSHLDFEIDLCKLVASLIKNLDTVNMNRLHLVSIQYLMKMPLTDSLVHAKILIHMTEGILFSSRFLKNIVLNLDICMITLY